MNADAFRLHCPCGRSYVQTIDLISCRHGVEPQRKGRNTSSTKLTRHQPTHAVAASAARSEGAVDSMSVRSAAPSPPIVERS